MSESRDENKTEIIPEIEIPDIVQPEHRKKHALPSFDPKDPMVIILVILLVFLTVGTAFGGCASENRRVVELDAAFGGDNAGDQGIVKEAEVTQKITDELADLLNKDGNYKVELTHESGSSSSVKERADKINADKPDFVLSIRADGSPDASASGQFIYENVPSDQNHASSKKLADFVQSAFTDGSWKPQTGYLYYQPSDNNTFQLLKAGEDDTKDYKLDTWDLMKETDVPVVISDQFYVTSQSDVDAWANDKGYQKAAQNYYKAIKDYYGSK